MKSQFTKDPIGGYRLRNSNIVIARENECRCCWYIIDTKEAETIKQGIRGLQQAKIYALESIETRNDSA